MKRFAVPAAWSAAIETWAVHLRAAGRSSASIETRTEHLRRFARQTGAPGPGMVSAARLVEWAGAREWARETRRSHYASLRAFYGWAVDAGICAEDPTGALPSIKPGPAVPRPATDRAYRDALAAADERGHVILRLAGEAGLRRGEIARVHRRDLLADLAGITLVVHGKGDRVRLVPLSPSLGREVERVLTGRDWLLPGPGGSHMTARHVGKLGSQWLPEGVTLHQLRHRFATVVNKATRDLVSVQRLLGHASVATTQRYVAVDEDTLRAAAMSAAV